MANPVIELLNDWQPDAAAGDTNSPIAASNAGITQSQSLAGNLRLLKSIIREESLNKSWESWLGIRNLADTADVAFTYVSGVQFTINDDFLNANRNVAAVGRRIRARLAGSNVHGIITASSYSSPNTTVTVQLDAGALDATLIEVQFGPGTGTYGVMNAGSATNPGLKVADDPDTGLAGLAANTLGLIVGGLVGAAVRRNASAVNYLDFLAAAAGFGPILSALGADTNIPLVLNAKGSAGIALARDNVGYTGKSMVVIDANSQLLETGNPSDGEILIGQTGGVPVLGAITGSGGLVVTLGAGTIDISAASLAQVAKGVVAATVTKNNNTTLGDITGLSASLAANKMYLVEVSLLLQATGATPDFKFKWTFPTSCEIFWGPLSEFNSSGAGGANAGWQSNATNHGGRAAILTQTDTLTTGSQNAIVGLALRAIIRNGANAGTLQLQFAQNTADVSDSSVLKGSAITARLLD